MASEEEAVGDCFESLGHLPEATQSLPDLFPGTSFSWTLPRVDDDQAGAGPCADGASAHAEKHAEKPESTPKSLFEMEQLIKDALVQVRENWMFDERLQTLHLPRVQRTA